MALHFNLLLSEAGVSLPSVRLLRHADTSAQKGRTPFELWRDDRPAFDLYQSIQSIRNRSRLQDASFWAAFGGTSRGDTVFLGLYSSQYAGVLENDLPHPHNAGVDRAGECDHYILEPSPLLSEFAGRLYVEWGEGKLSWIQRPTLRNKAVLELRRDLIDPPFPGYIDFIEPLSRLEALPQAWRDALRIAKGVYLLTCARTKEQYVGKADGGDGFLGRWRDYIANGHGGNVGLLRREPGDYQVSILETAGSAATANDILKMEERWKKKLRSKEMGLNH